MLPIAVFHAQGTLTSIEYRIDANENITGISSGTNNPDGKIARENAERKAKEKKEQEEKVAKRREKKPTEEEKAAKEILNVSSDTKKDSDYADWKEKVEKTKLPKTFQNVWLHTDNSSDGQALP